MTIRVAIVGTGKVADQNYLPHIVKNDDVVLSYYNRTRSKAQAMADKYGGRVATSITGLMACRVRFTVVDANKKASVVLSKLLRMVCATGV